MRKWALALVAALPTLLGGCFSSTPLVTPDSPRIGALLVVDPVLGTPIPGTPMGNGGCD